MGFLIFACIIFLILFFNHYFLNWEALPWPENYFKLPSYQVHRGFWKGGLQENTIPAFQEAARQGAEMVELDVMLTKDQQVICYHDKDLKRLFSREEKVSELTAQQMRELAKAPLLEEVLTDPLCPRYINIEIKPNVNPSSLLVGELKRVLDRTQSHKRVVITSFCPFTLRSSFKYLPEVPRGLLATDDPNDSDSAIYLRKMWLGGFCKAHFVDLDKRMINKPFMDYLKKRKIPVTVWTLNDPETAKEFRSLGVNSIITDLSRI